MLTSDSSQTLAAELSNLIPLADVARELNVTARTVAGWRVSGRLQCWRAGGRWYTTQDAIRAFLVPSGQPVARTERPTRINRRQHQAAASELKRMLTD